MLVFGGFVVRDKKDPDGNLLYETCEKFDMETLDPKYKNCGLELSNDLWRYHVSTDEWTFIKPDTTVSPAPKPRYLHAAVYVE